MIQLYIPLNFLGVLYREIKQSLTDLEKMFTLMDREREVADRPEALPLGIGRASIDWTVRFENVQFAYEPARQILHDVSFEIPAGRTVAVVGPSGSGKSTLLHCIGGIEAVDAGRITAGDDPVTALGRRELTAYRRRIGLVFQRSNLLPALTAIDNVMAPVLPYRTAFDKRERAAELLRAVGLEGREASLPARMSGGQQQRVAIARALINEPGLVLADEPTGALDSATGAEIVDLLLSLRDRRGVTLIIATHDAEVAGRCDRVVELHDGRVAGAAAPPLRSARQQRG
jgi:putative ABC transport system ATP-binding protein